MASLFLNVWFKRTVCSTQKLSTYSVLIQDFQSFSYGSILVRYSRPYSVSSSDSTIQFNDITVAYDRGLVAVSLKLPSRLEQCRFTLRPLSDTLADFARYVQEEDHGVDFIAAYNTNGDRIAKQTPIHILVRDNFTLQLNNRSYKASAVSGSVEAAGSNVEGLEEVKNAVVKLYSALNINEHQVLQERELLTRLETLKSQMQPLEEKLVAMQAKAHKRTKFLTWLGLGLMGAQFGFLARLTWWEYSWDIMEPVTYFVTYGTSLAMYAYYVVTRQDYNYVDIRNREYLLTLHREAKKGQFDVAEYNRLRESISNTQHDLRRLRDPLQLHLPVEQLQKQTEA